MLTETPDFHGDPKVYRTESLEGPAKSRLGKSHRRLPPPKVREDSKDTAEEESHTGEMKMSPVSGKSTRRKQWQRPNSPPTGAPAGGACTGQTNSCPSKACCY